MLVTDDTDITDTDSTGNDFSVLFTPDYGADGEATVDPIVYALSLSDGNGTDSGLTDAVTDERILLRVNGDGTVVTGYLETSGDTAFTLTLDPEAGTVAQEQLRAIEHDNADDPVESGNEAEAIANGAVLISATITDGDGDSATADAIAIGSSFTFEDDGPAATDNENTVTEGDETDGNVITDDDGDGVDDAGEDGYSADGQVVDAELASANQNITVISKSVDADTGAITIVTTAGTLVLQTNGDYTFSADANSIDGDAEIVFNYTIEDGDGDQDTATLTIDVTNVAGSATAEDLVVDEKGLPSVGTGEEADNIPENDQSEIDSDQIDVTGASANAVLSYELVGGTYDEVTDTWTVSTDYGDLVLNGSTGVYTFTLNDNYLHDPDAPGADRNTELDALSFDYKVNDQFGNVIADSTEPGGDPIVVDIIDDIPEVDIDRTTTTLPTLDTFDEDTIGGTSTDTANYAGAFEIAESMYGADGAGSLNTTYALVLAPEYLSALDRESGLTSDGDPIYLYKLANGTIVGSTADTAPTTIDDSVVFSLTIDTDTADVTLTQYAEIDHSAATAAPDYENDATYNTDTVALPTDLIEIEATATIIDADLDVVTDTEVLDLGNLVTFADDGPNAQASATGAMVTHDETPGIDADADDFDGTLAVFDDVANKGSDADMATGFAISDGAILSSTGSTYGADGPGTIIYSLDVSVEGVDSGLTTTEGGLIRLYNEDGIIVGRVDSATGPDAAVNQDGLAAFAISIDEDTGVVSVVQYLSLAHDDTDSHDESISIDNGALLGVVTVTDGETNADSDTDAVAIGNLIEFEDDGPSVAISADGEADVVLKTFDAETIGGDFDTATSQADFSGVFSIASQDYGADGEGSIEQDYELVLLGNTVDGTDSGLTINDAPIYLRLVPGDDQIVVGSTSQAGALAAGNIVFTIEVNDDGVVTLTQFQELDHDAADTSDYETDVIALDTGLVGLKGSVTITDGDGDTATDDTTIDLGDNITFADDGPDVEISANSNASITVSDADLASGSATLLNGSGYTRGNDTDVLNSPALDTGGPVVLTSLDTEDYGADGEGSLVYSLNLDNVDGTTATLATSLQTTEEQPITLIKVSDTLIVGRIGNTSEAAFAIAINPDTGAVTVEQYVSIEHGDSTPATDSVSLLASQLYIGATITDGDDDVDTDYTGVGDLISFGDDTPTAGNNATVQLDDDGWAGADGNPGVEANGDDADSENTSGTLAHDFGADGGSIAFDLTSTAPSGFQFISDGDNGVLIQQLQGGSYVTVVTVTLDPSDGTYSVSQNDNILHASGDGENNVSFTLGYIVTDGDEDTATGSLTINVDDDTPVAIANASVSGSVDEDNVPGGIEGGPDDIDGGVDTVTNIVSGTALNGQSAASLFSAGADAPLAYSIISDDADAVTDYLTGLSLTSGGEALEYTVTGNSITAVTETSGDPVFTFSLQSNGDWTFTLQGPLDHEDDGNNDENERTINFGPVIQATDADGDSVTATGDLEITVDDDTPEFGDNSATAPVLVTDDTNITDMDSDGNDFSTLFSPNYGADGPAAGASITYAFALADVDQLTGVLDSGLNDTLSGDDILLRISPTADNVIQGYLANDTGVIAFELTLNSDGTIDQTQYRAIVHDDATDPEEAYNADPALDASETMAAGMISLTATITDADGDSVTSDPVAIGDSFHFEDDGPDVEISVAANTSVTVSDADLASGAATLLALSGYTQGNDTDVAGSPAVDKGGPTVLTSLDTEDYGEDGEGSLIYSLNLDNLNGETGSLLSSLQTTGEQPITLVKVSDTLIVGQIGNTSTAAFAISIDPDSGAVSVEQYVSIEHGDNTPATNSVSLLASQLYIGATITDGDSDTDTDFIGIGNLISFGDDVPSVTLSGVGEPSLLVDESNLAQNDSQSFASVFSVDYGADGSAGTVYTLGITGTAPDSGLIDTATGNKVYLFLIGGEVVGKSGTNSTTAASGPTVFKVTVDGSGNVTLDQQRAVVHSNTSSDDESSPALTDNLITLTATAKDGDEDTASATINIAGNLTFKDDGPDSYTPDDATLTNVANASFTGDLDDNDTITAIAGADGVKSVTFDITNGETLFKTGTTDAVKVGGQVVKLYVQSDGSLVATTDIADSTKTVFIATLDSTSSTYDIDLLRPLDDGRTSVSDFSNAAAGNTPWKGIDSDLVKIQDTANDPNPDSTDLLLTPIGATTINTDADDIGTGTGQKVNPQEALRIDLVQDLQRDANQTEANAGGYKYDDHVAQKVFTFKFVDVQGNASNTTSVLIKAYNVTDDPSLTSLAQTNVQDASINTLVDIDPASIVVRDSSGTVRTTGITVIDEGFGVYVVGARQGDTITFEATGGASFEAVTIENANGDSFGGVTYGGSAFGLGGFEFGENTAGEPVSFELPILLTDGDGDSEAGVIDVTINPASVPVVLDIDGGGNAFSSLNAGIAYDYNGDGEKVKTAWIAAGSAILAFDANADGIVTDASEFVFGGNGMTDLEAIAAKYDGNGDGVLDAQDAAYASFGVWLDSDLDAISDPGEFVSLSDMGIVSIDLGSDGIAYDAADGDVVVSGSSSFTWADGSTGEVSDAAFATGGSADMAMMEALLALGEEAPAEAGEGAETVARSTADLPPEAQEALDDALDGEGVDNLIEHFAGENPDAMPQVDFDHGPVHAGALFQFLGEHMSGSDHASPVPQNDQTIDDLMVNAV